MTSTSVNVNSSGQVRLGNGAQFWGIFPSKRYFKNDFDMACNFSQGN
jgi:hypothetical protein